MNPIDVIAVEVDKMGHRQLEATVHYYDARRCDELREVKLTVSLDSGALEIHTEVDDCVKSAVVATKDDLLELGRANRDMLREMD